MPMAPSRSAVLGVLLLASLTTVLFQGIRATFPLARSLAERTDYLQAGALVISVVALTLLAGLLRSRVAGRRYLVLAVGATTVLWVWQNAVARPSLWPMMALLVVGTLALGAVLASPAGPRGTAAASGLLLGGAIDAAIKCAFATWDPIWQGGAIPMLVNLLLAAALVGTAFATLRRIGDAHPQRALQLPGLTVAGVGGWLAMVFLCLANTALVASNSSMGLAASSAVTLGGWLVAMALVGRTLAPGLAVVAGIALTAVAVAMPVSSGPVTALLAVAGMALGGPLLALTLRGPESGGGPGRLTVGVGLAMVAFTTTQFVYQIHYGINLPVWNNWVLVAPGLLLILTARHGARQGVSDPASRALLAVPALALGLVPLGLVLTAPTLQPSPGAELRVLNYNIHEGISNNGENAPPVALDLEAIADTIEASRPNVVLLQEVGRGWSLSGYTDEGLWLERRLGMPMVYGPAADNQFGNAVYSSMPIDASQTIDLGQGQGPMRRSTVGARIGTSFGSVWAWSVHLQHDEQSGQVNADDRIMQLETWLRASAATNGSATLIGGDFNAEPDSEPVRLMERNGFVNGQYGSGVTVTGPDPARTYIGPGADIAIHLDYIFASKDLAFTSFDVTDSQSSDHKPLFATLVRGG